MKIGDLVRTSKDSNIIYKVVKTGLTSYVLYDIILEVVQADAKILLGMRFMCKSSKYIKVPKGFLPSNIIRENYGKGNNTSSQ